MSSDDDVFVFGTYYSHSRVIDNKRTARRDNAKWRSQYRVPKGSIINSNAEDWYRIGSAVIICNISDLDYQLKTTKPIGNKYWIRRTENLETTYNEDSAFKGKNVEIVFDHKPLQPSLSSNNPNGDLYPPMSRRQIDKPLPEFISFYEGSLSLGVDYGATGGAIFNTTVVETKLGRQQRNALYSLPLHRYQLGDRTVADRSSSELKKYSQIKQFHTLRRGSYQGFRYKDWADYRGKSEFIAVGNGVITQFQLRKAYKAGEAVTYRPIQKPVPNTVFIYENGQIAPDVVNNPGDGWHINVETGVLTRAAALPAGVVLNASFEFDVPVWFESDRIDFTWEYYDSERGDNVYRLGSVNLIEKRLPLTLPWYYATQGDFSNPLDLGVIYGTVEQYEFVTKKLVLKSGFEKTESQSSTPAIYYNLGAKNYNREEIETILGFFWNARGKNRSFKFVNQNNTHEVRFDSDSLSLKFLALRGEDALFSVEGIKLQVVV